MIELSTIDDVVAAGPYEATWDSLARAEEPDWFQDAKFGIFTHWGLYTVPQFRNEWYSRNMYIRGYPEYEHHRDVYGPQNRFGYKDFIPLFTAKGFDPDEWLDLFAESGARYYFPVSEHHDGFQMYRSEISHWNSVEKGPHRDILGELRESTLRHGMHFCTSNHRAEHWWFMGHGREFDSDVAEPMSKGDFYWPAMPEPDNQDLFSVPRPTKEYLDDWLLRVCEVIDRYRPEMLYFDWWIQHEAFKPYVRRMAAYYYNRAAQWGIPVSICYKEDAMAWGAGTYEVERGGLSQATPYPWQTDTAIARNSWCYTNTLDYKSLSEIITTLIDVVSKNGNILLNVGPRADGSIADHDRDLLGGIGRWLRTYGEGIYGSRPWRFSREGPTEPPSGAFSDQKETPWTSRDFRFTSRRGALYVFCMRPGDEEKLTVKSLASYHDGKIPPFHGVIDNVTQLGAGKVNATRTDDGLIIVPARNTDRSLPVGFRIDVR